jgi:prepilin-type processing-associated H-X9-DG protein
MSGWQRHCPQEDESMNHTKLPRPGFARIDLFVLITVVGVSISLLLPAVQTARESARQSQCANNLRQLCSASLRFEQAQGYVPPGRSKYIPPAEPKTRVHRGYMIWILPYLEQTNLASIYDPNADWYDAKNQKAIQTQVPLLYCPSSPDQPRTSSGTTNKLSWTGACIDYGVVSALDQEAAKYQGVSSVKSMMRGFVRNKTRLSEVTDGLSNSILFIERAGLPDVWACGKKVDPAAVGTTRADLAKQGVWAIGTVAYGVRGQTLDGLSHPGPYAVNRSNYKGVYSFHPGYAHVAMGDGSVRALGEGIDIYAFFALCTIQAGDALPAPGTWGNPDLPKRKPVVPVRGAILVAGKPAVGAAVCFHPRSDPSPRAWRSFGCVGIDGTFSLTTHVKADGAPQGDYVVTVFWGDPATDPRDGDDVSALRPDLLKGQFAARESSPLRARVGGKAIEFAPVDLDSCDVVKSREYCLREK